MESRFWISAVLLVACLFGCDEQKVEQPRPKTVFGSGTIRGVVKFVGTPPQRPVIRNEPCHSGAAKELKDETVVVNENNTLANVLVYLEGVPSSDGSDRAPALLDQKDCQYVPHVVAVQVGQPLTIRSSDATMHNVHYNASANTPANFGMTQAGAEKPVTFKNAEFIRVKCDVHPWMTAHIGVFEHPFFAATSEGAGNYTIEKIPAGQYKLVAWHEQYGKIEQPVTVADNQSQEIELTYKAPTGAN